MIDDDNDDDDDDNDDDLTRHYLPVHHFTG